jgi:phosphatidylglycerophosphatase A
LSVNTRSIIDRCVLFLAQGCGLGWSPRAPGTFGSLGGLALVWAMQKLPNIGNYIAVELAVIAVGVWLCTRAGRLLGQDDPGSVVWDEIAAFPIVFFMIGLTPLTAVLGFLWFRVFDISKIWPIKYLERLPTGWGVMADDLLAGVFAAGALRLTLWIVGHFYAV